MPTDHHATSTSAALENAFATAIGRIQAAIDTAPGLADAGVEQLARLVELASELESRTAFVASRLDVTEKGAQASYWSEVERAEQERLTDEQVAAELRRYEWSVDRILAADETYEDGYRVSSTRTAKGVRAFLGERRFLAAMCVDR